MASHKKFTEYHNIHFGSDFLTAIDYDLFLKKQNFFKKNNNTATTMQEYTEAATLSHISHIIHSQESMNKLQSCLNVFIICHPFIETHVGCHFLHYCFVS